MKLKKYQTLILFILGFGIFMFTRRSELFRTIQVAIIIAPILILRFSRTQRALKGILLTLLGFTLSMNIALWGLFQGSNEIQILMLNIIRSTLLAILYFLPYMVDRLVYFKFKDRGFCSTLVFPIIVTAVFFLSSLEGPFDGGSAKGIYVYGNLAMKQLSSITGLWGFIFIYSWLAGLINYVWENKFAPKIVKQATLVYFSVIVLIIGYGNIKMSTTNTKTKDKVKVAAAVLFPEDGKAVSMESVFKFRQLSNFEKTIGKIERLTKEAAMNHAKMITFQENAIVINEKDNPKLINICRQLALDNDIYISLTYASLPDIGKGENLHIFIDDNGELLIRYVKRFLLGFGSIGETVVFRKGAEIIQSVETPFGKVGIAICRDMNFSHYIRQAAEQNVDIMLASAYDYPRGTVPAYTLRAVEYGFTFIRATYNGVTFFQDYNGNIINQMSFEESKQGLLFAEIPTKGINTIFGIVGDLFGWSCFVGMIGLIVFSIISKKKL